MENARQCGEFLFIDALTQPFTAAAAVNFETIDSSLRWDFQKSIVHGMA
jgi:hypothetical protein